MSTFEISIANNFSRDIVLAYDCTSGKLLIETLMREIQPEILEKAT